MTPSSENAPIAGTASENGPIAATVVCPGSYDPITNGHLDVIRRAAALYQEVVIAVVNRSVRKSDTLFGIEERLSFIEHATGDLPGVRAEPFNTLVVEFARKVGAKAIVKGLRAISDFEYELEMHQLNRRLDPEIESVYLMASSEYSFLSSSGVKELAIFGGNIDDLVPGEVAKRLQEELRR
jgi:pantetheine-phosphate adenylyltransferase